MNAFISPLTAPLTDAVVDAANAIISSAGIDAVIDRVNHTIEITDDIVGSFNIIDRPAIFELSDFLAEAKRFSVEKLEIAGLYSLLTTARVTIDVETVGYEVVVGEVADAFANLHRGSGYSITNVDLDLMRGVGACDIKIEVGVVDLEDIVDAVSNLEDTGISVYINLSGGSIRA